MKNKINMVLAIIPFLVMWVLVINDLMSKNSEEEYVVSNKVTTSVIETTAPTTTTYTIATTTTKRTTKKANIKYTITHYGADCKGCSGTTASGYNVKDTMFYNDQEYGQLRICATSNKFKMYSVLRIKNYKLGEINCIVLDRGVTGNIIDLLVSSEKVATQLGIQKNIEIEILRSGK